MLAFLVACGGAEPSPTAPVSPVPNSTAAATLPTTDVNAEPPKVAAPPKQTMHELQMRSLRTYVRAFNQHDAKAIGALYAEDAAFVERGEFFSGGAESIEGNFKEHFDTFPDTTTTITRSWHRGNLVVFEYLEGGTHTGPQRAHKPTKKKYGYVGASVLTFKADGTIEKDETYSDELTKEVQLGWAPGPLAKMEVRPVLAVPPATETWEVHVGSGGDAETKLAATRRSIYANFALRSEKAFESVLSDDVVLSAYDDPKDARGKKEAVALFKAWIKMFADATIDSEEAWSVDGHSVVLGTFAGKHVGAWGPLKPTNKTFKAHFLDIVRINKADKVDRVWSYANNYELLRQLGYAKVEAKLLPTAETK